MIVYFALLIKLIQLFRPDINRVFAHIAHEPRNGANLCLIGIELGPGVPLYLITDEIEPTEIELPHNERTLDILKPPQPHNLYQLIIPSQSRKRIALLDRPVFFVLEIVLHIEEYLL